MLIVYKKCINDNIGQKVNVLYIPVIGKQQWQYMNIYRGNLLIVTNV